MALPNDKREKYLQKLNDWSSLGSISLKTTESLIGTLNHACLVIPHGRSHLASLYAFCASFPVNTSHFLRHRPHKAVREDVEWWKSTLSKEWCGINIVRPPEPLDDELFVNVSTSWGVGLVLNNKWLAWPLKSGWKSDGRDIGWAEMIAINLAVKTLITAGYTGCHIILKSDNTGVVGALAAGYSRSTQQNFILRHIVDSFQMHNIWLTIKWVPTDLNIADRPSRGNFPSRSLLFPFPPAVPPYLKEFIRFPIRHNKITSM